MAGSPVERPSVAMLTVHTDGRAVASFEYDVPDTRECECCSYSLAPPKVRELRIGHAALTPRTRSDGREQHPGRTGDELPPCDDTTRPRRRSDGIVDAGGASSTRM